MARRGQPEPRYSRQLVVRFTPSEVVGAIVRLKLYGPGEVSQSRGIVAQLVVRFTPPEVVGAIVRLELYGPGEVSQSRGIVAQLVVRCASPVVVVPLSGWSSMARERSARAAA